MVEKREQKLCIMTEKEQKVCSLINKHINKVFYTVYEIDSLIRVNIAHCSL